MATIRTKFRSSSAEGREGALYYQVIHNRVVRQISTGYKLFASEWDQRSEAVIPCQHPAGMERDNYLLSVGERIRRDKIRLEKAIRTLSQSGPFTADDIVIRFHDSGQEPSFNDYIRQQIVRLKRLGKIRTSETYTAALKSFSSFMKGSDILFGELSSDLLMEYEAYLKNRGELTQYNLVLHAHSESGLQPCGGERTDRTAEPVQVCLYRCGKDLETGHSFK